MDERICLLQMAAFALIQTLDPDIQIRQTSHFGRIALPQRIKANMGFLVELYAYIEVNDVRRQH
jgi:hypothetical protein